MLRRPRPAKQNALEAITYRHDDADRKRITGLICRTGDRERAPSEISRCRVTVPNAKHIVVLRVRGYMNFIDGLPRKLHDYDPSGSACWCVDSGRDRRHAEPRPSRTE